MHLYRVAARFQLVVWGQTHALRHEPEGLRRIVAMGGRYSIAPESVEITILPEPDGPRMVGRLYAGPRDGTYRTADDPDPRAFVYLTVEQVLAGRIGAVPEMDPKRVVPIERLRPFALHAYAMERSPAAFAPDWRRVQEQLVTRVASVLVNALDRTIVQSAVDAYRMHKLAQRRALDAQRKRVDSDMFVAL